MKAEFTQETKYPTWLSDVVMVNKKFRKRVMCIDLIDLDKACLKYPYPLPHIDKLIEGACGFCLLRFMDAYLGYNQIFMNSMGGPKIAFMTNESNYYHKVMPFGLKNVEATYQMLMD